MIAARRALAAALAAALAGAWAPGWAETAAGVAADAPVAPRALDVPYEPSPDVVVRAMLEVAQVGPNDVVYDLGSGDGRVVIAAAKLGARAVGIDLDPQRVREANENARKAGVADQVRFIQGDLFEQDLSGATVVTMFLWPHVNMRLRPTLLQLKPGTRIVSHWHDLGDWAPQRTLRVKASLRVHNVYYWEVPPRNGARN